MKPSPITTQKPPLWRFTPIQNQDVCTMPEDKSLIYKKHSEIRKRIAEQLSGISNEEIQKKTQEIISEMRGNNQLLSPEEESEIYSPTTWWLINPTIYFTGPSDIPLSPLIINSQNYQDIIHSTTHIEDLKASICKTRLDTFSQDIELLHDKTGRDLSTTYIIDYDNYTLQESWEDKPHTLMDKIKIQSEQCLAISIEWFCTRDNMDIHIGDISPQLFSFHERWLYSNSNKEKVKKLYTTLHHITKLPWSYGWYSHNLWDAGLVPGLLYRNFAIAFNNFGIDLLKKTTYKDYYNKLQKKSK